MAKPRLITSERHPYASVDVHCYSFDAGRHWMATLEISSFTINGAKIKKLRRSFDRARQAAGIEATPHTLRHTRATWLMQAGVAPWEAAGHLGMSLEMLERTYGKHSPDFQKRAANV